MSTALSRKTRTALKAYGHETCAKAFLLHHCDGEGGRTVGFYMGLTTRQADAAIDAGEAFFRDQHRIETEMLTSSCSFDRYVRANRPNYL